MTVTIFARSLLIALSLETLCSEAGLRVRALVDTPDSLRDAADMPFLIAFTDGQDVGLGESLAVRHSRQTRIVLVHPEAAAQTEMPLVLDDLEQYADAVVVEPDVSAVLVPTLAVVRSGYQVHPLTTSEARQMPHNRTADRDRTGLDELSRPTARTGSLAARLSAKERDILGMLPQGPSNKDIARTLKMSEATVKVHLRAIYGKLRVPNRTSAALWSSNNLPLAERKSQDQG